MGLKAIKEEIWAESWKYQYSMASTVRLKWDTGQESMYKALCIRLFVQEFTFFSGPVHRRHVSVS